MPCRVRSRHSARQVELPVQFANLFVQAWDRPLREHPGSDLADG